MKVKNIIIIFILLIPSYVYAERDEMGVGLQTGLLLPDFNSTSSTAFVLATWTAGAQYMYGVLDDLYLIGEFHFSTFSAQSRDYSYVDSSVDLTYDGTLVFDTAVYQTFLKARYKVLSGYPFAPYVEGGFGYIWSTYTTPQLANNSGSKYDIDISDFAFGTWVMSIGIHFDYRLFNSLLAGFGFRYVRAFEDEIFTQYFSIPVEFTYYW